MVRAKLTPAQERMLRQVVATNGGGVFAGTSERSREAKLLRALEGMGLVQGKAGGDGRAVHTREGLAWVRFDPLDLPLEIVTQGERRPIPVRRRGETPR